MRIMVYDQTVRQWRYFEVVPVDPQFKARCLGMLHQFPFDSLICSCGQVRVP